MARKGEKATKSINVAERTVTFTWADGAPPTVCRYDDLSEAMRVHVGLFGINHKGGDSYSQAESVADARERCEATWNALLRGEWEIRIVGGILVEALARATGRGIDECRPVVAAMDDAAKRKLGKHKDILQAIADIRAERAGESEEDLAKLF